MDQAETGGAPRFAQVTGEPGIGKTYLLAELARRADANGWLVLSGRSAELEREFPFGLVVDAFDAYLASLDVRDWERIAPDELSELAGLFPSLRSLVDAPSQPTTPGERFRAHRAVVEMIERLAARQPVLLLLDDLHWADPASIEQAGYVLRRPPQAPVVIAGSFRTGQADPALMTAAEAAAREGYVELIELGPLDPAAAELLLDAAPQTDDLYELSGGNPFYLLQLTRSSAPRSGATVTDNGGEVPAAVAAAITGELGGLSETARAFADAAAVAGDPFELDLAAEIAGVSEPDALSAVDELIERDLARPSAVPRSFQFRHPLVRSATYERISPGARLAAHQRAADALARRGAPAAERAHHVEHAARHGDTTAVAILKEAGDGAAGRAPQTAARWLGAALRLLPGTGADEVRLELLMSRAGALAATGHLEQARSALVECIGLASDEGPLASARIISACAGVEQLLGRRDEAHGRLTAALEQLEGSGSSDEAALMIDLAVDAFYSMDYAAMAEWADRAVDTAEALDDQAVEAAALAIAAFAYSLKGPVKQAKSLCQRAADVVDGLRDEVLSKRLDATTWLVASEFYLDAYEPGEAHARRGLALARATGQGELLPGLIQGLANILLISDRPAEAGELLDEAVEAARLGDNAVGLAWSLLNRSYAAVTEGDVRTALSTGKEATELTEALPGTPVCAWAGATYAAALLDAGEARRATDIIVERAGGAEAPLIPGAWRANWLEWMTRCWLALDDGKQAKRAAELSWQRAEEFGLDVAMAAAHRAAAEVALWEGDLETCAERALASAECGERAGALGEVGLSRLLAGRALAEAGEKDRAIAELEQAAEVFGRGQALRRAEEVGRELRKLGRGTHRRTRAGTGEGGVESLTGRELEVAQLVVDRRTNAEIASELFLSVKTVETHMRNIFRKLDVSSRVEVARVLERQAES